MCNSTEVAIIFLTDGDVVDSIDITNNYEKLNEAYKSLSNLIDGKVKCCEFHTIECQALMIPCC